MTWARCECGCGWEGEDEVTQFALELAGTLALDELESQAAAAAVDDELARVTAELEDTERVERLTAMGKRALGKPA